MKNNFPALLVFAFVVAMSCSCKKKIDLIAATSTTENMAFLKVIDAAPSFRKIFNGRDSFNVYVNGIKVNGSFLTYNTVFPTTTNLYTAVPAGPQSIRITANGVLTPDSITFASFNKTLDAGSYYSFIITDSALTGNDAKQMFIKDNITLTDTSHYTLRFIDAVLNDPVSVDVYSYRNASNIFTNISPGTVTPFIPLPYTFLTDTLYVRTAGTQNEIARVSIDGNPFVLNRARAYTALYKGQFGLTGTKARALTIYGNQ